MKKFYFIFYTLVNFLFFINKANAQLSSEFVFIGNNIGDTSISFSKIINIFKAKNTSWDNNNTIIIVLPSGKAQNATEVSKYIYNTNFTSVQKFWLSEVFQGRSNPPVFFDTDEEIIQFVQKNEGAIGIVSNNKSLNIPPKLIIKIEK